MYDDHMLDLAPLRVLQLTKRYRLRSDDWLEAVSDLSFEVRAGECFGLLGPNGAGKTTAIQCIGSRWRASVPVVAPTDTGPTSTSEKKNLPSCSTAVVRRAVADLRWTNASDTGFPCLSKTRPQTR